MSATATTVLDFTPGAFRSKLARTHSQPTPHAESVFSDMADGILALDFGLTFAGFEYEERQLIISVAGLLGDTGNKLSVCDEEVAEHLKCSTRTVRRWRAAYMKKSQSLNFGFIEVTEGEYIVAEKKFKPTSYHFTDDAKAYVESTVDEARRSCDYKRNRRGSIEKAACAHYEDVPQAPIRRRDNKPKRSTTLQIERDFINAKNNLTKGRNTLDGLPERARNVFLASAQGRELHALLLKLQTEVADILQDFPQTVDGVEVDNRPDILSNPFGVSDAAEDESARTPPYQATSPAEDESGTSDAAEEKNPSTCVRPSSSYTRTQDSEAAAIFERFDERLRQPRATEPPKISKVEIEIVADVEIEERKASFSEELFKPPDDNSDENH